MTEFVFITCQVGAEPAVKRELSQQWPKLRFAFSRPGFLTFKRPPDLKLPDDFGRNLVFARAAGFCIGKAAGRTPAERIDRVVESIGELSAEQLHVFPRDRHSPGYHDYEPGVIPEAIEADRAIRERLKQIGTTQIEAAAPIAPVFELKSSAIASKTGKSPNGRRSKTAPLVLDVVLVEPDEWWLGFHRVHSLVSCWPGGFFQSELPEDAVSRAWLKMQEAFVWSEFRLQAGQKCVEIGSAPGGASQFLLAQGLQVTGVDPAEMHQAVVAQPHFRHIRKRSKEVPRREFVGFDWLTCDVNLPPNYTLDTVKAIVSHPGVRFRGMLLTLKLIEWDLAAQIPKYVDRIRSWGFRHVRARQLHHNRQEICVAASDFRGPAVARKAETTKSRRLLRPKAPDRRSREKREKNALPSRH